MAKGVLQLPCASLGTRSDASDRSSRRIGFGSTRSVVIQMLLAARRALLSVVVGLAFSVVPVPPSLADSFAQVPSCAVGKWRVSYPEIEETFRGMMRPYLVDGVTGEVLYAIHQDGSFELRYDQVAIKLRSEGEPGSIGVDGIIRGVLSGRDLGVVRGTDPSVFEGTLTDLSVAVVVVLGQESRTMTVDSLPEMRGSAPHECAGGLLLIGTAPWPDGNWVRLIFRKQ